MRRPNVLFIVTDCLRLDLISGDDRRVQTPAVDALARRGTSFGQLIASSSTTVPSLATLLTGTFPFRHGVRAIQGDRLAPDLVTLPEVLRAQGYHTLARVTGPLLPQTGIDRGFSDYQWRAHREYLDGPWGQDLRRSIAGREIPEPWFLLLHLWELHWPRHVPARFRRRRFGHTLYEQAVSALDAQLAKLFEAVPGDTLVSFSSDHGELHGGVFDDPRVLPRLAANTSRALWRAYRINLEGRMPSPIRRLLDVRRGVGHAVPGHGFHVYDYLIRVPWILAGPGVQAGATVDVQVRHADIAATLLGLLGIDPPTQCEPGLTEAIAGRAEPDRPAYAEAPGVPRSDPAVWIAGLRTQGLKYAYGPYNSSIPEQLFDLVADPAETRNLAPGRPSVARAMREELERFTAVEAGARATPLTIEEELVIARRLKELGYLEE